MGREIDARQEIEASLAAVQRLRERRTALVEELEEIDQSLENIHRQIGDILSNGRPASGSFPASQSRSFERKAPKKDPELTVNAAVLQVIRDAYKEISKSEIRIGAMRLTSAFSESALNAALTYWVDEKKIKNTSRGYYEAT